MNITITFRHMVGTEAVKSYAHEKMAKLQKFLRQAMSAQVTLSVEGLEHVAEALDLCHRAALLLEGEIALVARASDFSSDSRVLKHYAPPGPAR